MKLLYVSHRYHTNQIPIMKGWHNRGDQVMFLSQYEGVSEVHEYVEFHRLRPSLMTIITNKYYDITKDASTAESRKIDTFIPNIINVIHILRRFMPDIVILREYRMTSLIVSLSCRLLRIPNVIMYNQLPLYNFFARSHKLDSISKRLFPSHCFSPVLYIGENRMKKKLSTGWYAPKHYVPLVCEPAINAETKEYLKDNKIHIIDIGKYRPYKNHFLLVDAIAGLKDPSRFHVKIIGQVSQSAERRYYEKLRLYIAERQLSEIIELVWNVPFLEMNKIYSCADVLILPSYHDSAPMVILEAMANGLCVISSINAGLACYLEEHDCGFVVSVDNPSHLSYRINYLSENPEVVHKMGQKGLSVIKEYYSFKDYLTALDKLCNEAFNIKLENL